MYYKDYPTIKSPELKAIIVEQILVVCVNRIGFNELFDAIRRITSFSRNTLKKYLFHLIEQHHFLPGRKSSIRHNTDRVGFIVYYKHREKDNTVRY
jgi:hypothetical protein